MNPYTGANFFEFFGIFFRKVLTLPLASDEIQIFVLAFIAMGASVVGVLLSAKKMTMLANSLSHTILLGIVASFLLFSTTSLSLMSLFVAAIITGLITTLLTQFLHEKVKLQEDASIGLVFTTLFALGIVLITVHAKSAHIGLEIVMGNPDALHLHDLKLSAVVALICGFFVTIFFKEWKLISFDPSLAKAMGFRPKFFNYLLMFLTSCVSVSAFRAIGVLLFLSFLVGPPLIARMWTSNFKKLMFLAPAIGAFSAFVSVALSRHLLSVYDMPLSTAGLTTCVIGGMFFLSAFRKLTFRKIPA